MRISKVVREHLKFLELDGRLTPERVVNDAKRPDSPLHKHFTWDVQKAAEHYWLDQARVLIRTVQVQMVVNDITIKAPFYVPDPSRLGNEQGYTSLDTLRENPDAARQSLISECERAASVLRRARVIAAALGLETKVDAILMAMSALKDTAHGADSVQ
jgi:hypothetical protein